MKTNYRSTRAKCCATCSYYSSNTWYRNYVYPICIHDNYLYSPEEMDRRFVYASYYCDDYKKAELTEEK
jgi:hypothetical protein